MSTVADRSIAAEGCESLVDIIDDWVRGEATERTAERILERLPKEIQEALGAMLGGVEPPYGALVGGHRVDRMRPSDHRSLERILEERVEPVDIPSTDYELVITDQAFEPSYGGWNIQFQAIGAPRLAHQSSDPSLEAYVKLEIIGPTRQLVSGRGTAMTIVRDEDEPSRQALSILTGTSEGNILATGLGAASIDTGQVTEVPLALPNEKALLAAMKKSLEVHLQKVRDERARLKVTEPGEAFVGKSFKVKL